MSSPRQHSGRKLFTFGPRSGGESGFTAFSLLGAAPFSLRGPKGSRILNWGHKALAAQLLDTMADKLPQTNMAYQETLSATSARLRRSALESLKFDGARYTISYALQDEKGQIRWIEESAERVSGDNDSATYIEGVFKDITNEYQSKTQAAYDMRYDTLTGFYNAVYFQDILLHQQAAGHTAQIIQININNAGDIAAVYGASALDYVYQSLARRISGEVSPDDFVAFDRSKGYSLLFCGFGSENLLSRAKKLAYILRCIPIESPYGTLHPECEITIETPQAIKRQAIESSFRNLCTPSADLPELTDADVMQALEQELFCLAYQPICQSGTRMPIYYEALLRVKDKNGKLSTAFPYILAAEKHGLIGRIDLFVLRAAHKDLVRDPKLNIALNVSAGSIAAPDVVNAYVRILEAMGNDAKRVTVELTETMAVDNIGVANSFAARLRSMGCALAIDDFGTGHSSFQTLMGLEAQTIKIDGSYVKGIAVDQMKQNFVRMMAEMAQVFGLKIVAEMIDNEADTLMCERLGVDYLQGFFLGKPTIL